MSRLLECGQRHVRAAKSRAEALADQIKAALNELGETLSEQEDHVETLIAERPIAAWRPPSRSASSSVSC